MYSFDDQKPRLRVFSTLEREGRATLIDILHDQSTSNLPKDPKQLYNELFMNHQDVLKELLHKKFLKQEQWDLIFPASKETDSGKFDLTLCKMLIINCTDLPPPTNGWFLPLDAGDHSKAAFVVRIIELRNKLIHSGNVSLSEDDCNNFWKELQCCLKGLNFKGSIEHWRMVPFENLNQDVMKAHHDLFQNVLKEEKQRGMNFILSHDCKSCKHCYEDLLNLLMISKQQNRVKMTFNN